MIFFAFPPLVPASGENFTLGHLYIVGLNIITLLIYFSVFPAIAAIIWAGFLMVTSAGNEEKVKSAKGIATFALIGLGVVLLARVFVYQALQLLAANCPYAAQEIVQTARDDKGNVNKEILDAVKQSAKDNPGCAKVINEVNKLTSETK